MSHAPNPPAPPSSRRDFLKRSAGAVSAAALGGLALGRMAHAAGSDTLKVGLVGCGGRGSGAAANALNADPGAKLVAVCDLFDDAARGARDRLKQMKPEQVDVPDDRCFVGFDGYRKVIAESDVVVIACASRFHPQYLSEAVAAGKHVFVEKPHGIDPPGVRLTAAACAEAEQKGLAVVSGLCWRYHTGVQETIQRVLDGAIGEIVALQETYLRTPYRTDVVRKPDWSEITYQYRNWYHFNWLSGDDVLQSLIHSMDKAAWAMGDEPPVRAFGVGGRASSVGEIYGDVFDHNAIIYEYANGVRLYAMGRAANGCHNETANVFLGTKGRANILKYRIEGETNWRYEGPECNMYDAEHVALFQSIRNGTPINNGKYMVNSTLLGILGQVVCYTGQLMTWEEIAAADYTAGPDGAVDFNTPPPVQPDDKGIYPVPIPGATQLSQV